MIGGILALWCRCMDIGNIMNKRDLACNPKNRPISLDRELFFFVFFPDTKLSKCLTKRIIEKVIFKVWLSVEKDKTSTYLSDSRKRAVFRLISKEWYGQSLLL